MSNMGIIVIGKYYRRIKNKLSCYKNRIKLSLFGIKCGKNCIIHGYLGLRLAPDSIVEIGDNFYMSSGSHINPLARNIQGHICINKGAKLIIGNHVGMSSPVLRAHKSIKIGSNVKFGANVIVMDSDAHSMNYLHRRELSVDMVHKADAEVVIEDDVFIGMNTIVLKGVTIGARSVIGAGSVVVKSIPADCIAVGNPAKVIKRLE